MEKNARAWNEVTPIHQGHKQGQESFFASGGSQLDIVERRHLPDLRGLDVAHLCCNCGQDTLSLANLGARCTGFDLSTAAIGEARALAVAANIAASFVHANVLDIPPSFHGQFDLVYISKGALVWLPDLKLLMKNVSALLRPGGSLFLYDLHPFLFMLQDVAGRGLSVVSDYFRIEPEERFGLDYIGDEEYEASPNYQFMVRMSDLLNGMAENRLRLVQLLEFEHSMYAHFPGMEQREDGLFYFPATLGYPRVPVMMLVEAVKS